MTEAELLSTICARPNDDAPRLVMADLLSQRGDPRGEFIVISCALARAPDDRALKARHDELLTLHRTHWCAALGVNPATTSFSRGFIDGVVIDFIDETVGALERLFVSTPLTRLSLHSGFSAEQLVGLFERTKPPSLEVLNTALWGHRDALALVNSVPFTRALKTLIVDLERDTDGPTMALAKAPLLAKLDTLSFSSFLISRPVLDAFARSPHLRLNSLWFHDCELGDGLAHALAEGSSFEHLEVLDLTNNRLTDEGALALAQSPNLPRLSTVFATTNHFTDRGHEALRARFDTVSSRSKKARGFRGT